jgi:hypothetical protein
MSYESKRFPLTALQGRVLYHAERIFRSAGGSGCIAAQSWRDACADAALPVLVSAWTTAQCVKGLALIEWAARRHRMHLFRDVRTQWEDAALAEWHRAPEEYRASGAPLPERRKPPLPTVALVECWAVDNDDVLGGLS